MATNENFDGVIPPALPVTLTYNPAIAWSTVVGVTATNVLEDIGVLSTAHFAFTNVVSAANQSFVIVVRFLPVIAFVQLYTYWRCSVQTITGFNYFLLFTGNLSNIQMGKNVNSVTTNPIPGTPLIPFTSLPNNIDLTVSCFSAGARQYVSIQRADTSQYLTSAGTWSNILVYCFDVIDIDVPATAGGFAGIRSFQTTVAGQYAIDSIAHNDFTPILTSAYNMHTNMANIASF
jgi:hypothetical protein